MPMQLTLYGLESYPTVLTPGGAGFRAGTASPHNWTFWSTTLFVFQKPA